MECVFCGLSILHEKGKKECEFCFNPHLIEGSFGVLSVIIIFYLVSFALFILFLLLPIQTIGQGGFGRIFKGIYIETGNIVAIKERIKERNKDNWMQEIEMLKCLEQQIPTLCTSRLICSLDDTSRNISDKYIVMEFVEGKDLTLFHSLLANQLELSKEKELLRLMVILSNELRKLHAKGFLHRDIKLDNLMYYTAKDGLMHYIFIDFGSSFDMNAKKPRIPTNSPGYSKILPKYILIYDF